jgi:hypothetical protein
MQSTMCHSTDFTESWYLDRVSDLLETPRFHRKLWEFVVIVQALIERDMLRDGRHGLGFGVGTEPLPALFAARGVDVLATDLAADDVRAVDWGPTGQLAARIEDLQWPGICEPSRFLQRVRFQSMDMTRIPSELAGQFDFSWSSCAFEHLGSIQAGIDFIAHQVELLKPGGVAVHTTEFNCMSDDVTLEAPSVVIFRLRDVLRMRDAVRSAGGRLVPLLIHPEVAGIDGTIDLPPYSSDRHLKLRLADHVTTSVVLIVEKTPSQTPNADAAAWALAQSDFERLRSVLRRKSAPNAVKRKLLGAGRKTLGLASQAEAMELRSKMAALSDRVDKLEQRPK